MGLISEVTKQGDLQKLISRKLICVQLLSTGTVVLPSFMLNSTPHSLSYRYTTEAWICVNIDTTLSNVDWPLSTQDASDVIIPFINIAKVVVGYFLWLSQLKIPVCSVKCNQLCKISCQSVGRVLIWSVPKNDMSPQESEVILNIKFSAAALACDTSFQCNSK